MSGDEYHGTEARWLAGCRCTPCCRVRESATKRRRKEQRRPDGVRTATLPEGASHGTVNAYCNCGCRCDPCREAQRQAVATIRAERMQRRRLVAGRWVYPDVVHGTDSGYTNYGCRCDPCTVAKRETKRFEARAKYLSAGTR